ncbi:MAG: dual specificity protein phosphatase family protein [Candidatus Korarchaeum sp.]|nr:dual specificity protein phosphatase family protein [Candidatus Korarchaeum sp.]MDW8035209.1 dual specificity protein phosphatase family protein [Candidatus Korarchaeum sp.]
MRKPRNFSFIDQFVAGSALLSSIEEIDWLAANGITAVISLVELSPDVKGRLEELGIEHFSFPVDEFEAPPIEVLHRIVSLIVGRVDAGRKVLVHCFAGCGRTGTVLASYLIYKGMTPEEAISHLNFRRPCSLESQTQYNSLWYYYTYRSHLR